MDTKFSRQHDELTATWQELQRQWDRTKIVWRDRQRQEFEQHVWAPLSRDIDRVLKQVEEIDTLMKQAGRELPAPPGGR